MTMALRGLAIRKHCTYLFLHLYTGQQNKCFNLNSGFSRLACAR